MNNIKASMEHKTSSEYKPINVSIVRYENPFEEIKPLVDIICSSNLVNHIYIIDNSNEIEQRFKDIPVIYLFNGTNIGFGRAHNLAISKSINYNTNYHIVINPDISFASDIFNSIVDFLDSEKKVGALMPKVFYPNGQMQYLCKLLPSPMDLFGRRFLPNFLIKKRMEIYELHQCGYDKIMNIPYLSGCFMALRVDALKKVGLFDEQFFMYPEDIDLSRRLHEHYQTVFFPYVSVIHEHKKESYHNIKLLWIHTINIIRYFNKWGWILDKKRMQINKETLEQISQLK